MYSGDNNWQSIVLSVLVHGLCAVLAFLGLMFSDKPENVRAEGVVIEASLVDFSAKPLPASQARAKPIPRPPVAKVEPPKAERQPEPEQPKPAQVQRSEDTVDQEKVRLAAEALEKAEKEQEERIRKEQVDLTQPEDELTRMERERQKQLEDIRKQREEAEQNRKREAQRLAQLQDANKTKLAQQQRDQEQARMAALAQQEAQKSGDGGQDNTAQAQYIAAIKNKVRPNWLRPETAQNIRCKVRILQLPGGTVMTANILPPCYADEPTRRSMEAAVMRSDPLPYRGYEAVFIRAIDFEFCYPETLCQS